MLRQNRHYSSQESWDMPYKWFICGMIYLCNVLSIRLLVHEISCFICLWKVYLCIYIIQSICILYEIFVQLNVTYEMLCLRNRLFMQVFEMFRLLYVSTFQFVVSYVSVIFFINFIFFEMSCLFIVCLWNFLSMKCLIYELSCLWNVLSMKCLVYEMSCLWNA